ncbi:MAG: hypothetical protein ACI4EH_08735 [Oliverpabstia sp.]
MSKGIVGLMAGVCVLLGGAVVFLQMKVDHEPPTIHFQEDEITYTDGDSYDELLLGVTAIDDVDGDVTDTLVVESVYPEEDEKTVTVIYVARDQANNIGKANRKIIYKKSDGQTTLDTTGKMEDTPVQLKEDPGGNSENDSEDDEQEGQIQDENPHIKLTTDKVSIKAGDSVNRIKFVESITDDKDDADQLWGSILIVGDEFDNNVPGVYEQIYYVVDSDGNKSNEETLTITVE